MILDVIILEQFRNHEKGIFKLHPSLTVILGRNARGKTNILESIYVVLNSVGFRETKEEELVTIGKNTASIRLQMKEGDDVFESGIYLKRKEGMTEKIYLLQKSKKKHAHYLQEQPRAILFTPQHIDIVNGSPDHRRQYLNTLLSFYDREYKKKLTNYEQALRKRNKLFEYIKDTSQLQRELEFWNTFIEEQAGYLTQKRKEYIIFLNSNPSIDKTRFHIIYKPNEFTLERLGQVFDFERRIRKTAIGPHKDSIQVVMEDETFEKDMHSFGSRSEQRLAVLWLKMNEVQYHEMIYHKKPVLLLDDVFSEFDNEHKKLILQLVKPYQTILTTTEEELLDQIKDSKEVIRL